jgi:hypothetical protein
MSRKVDINIEGYSALMERYSMLCYLMLDFPGNELLIKRRKAVIDALELYAIYSYRFN